MHVELYDISFGFYCMPSREIIAMPVGTKLGARVARSCPYALLNQFVEASPDGMRSLPVTNRPVHSAAVYKFFSASADRLPQWRDIFSCLLVVALGCRPTCWGVRCQNGERPGDFSTAVVCRMSTTRKNGTEHAGTMKSSLRQRCDRQGFESLRALEVFPAFDILSAVNDNVEPHVRSLCGSSDHLLSRHRGRSVRHRGAGGDP